MLEALLIRSVRKEVQNRRHKGPVVLKDTAVPGVRIDRQLSIRQTASHVGRKAAVDHGLSTGHRMLTVEDNVDIRQLPAQQQQR